MIALLMGINDEVIAQPLFTYGDEVVDAKEFERVFLKNNQNKGKPDAASIEEYLQLYINFKLKVREAKNLGLDTQATFKQELAGYRKQLAQPYLSDKSVNESLIREAFDRLQWEINASHILIFCDEDALPKDTLKAWKKMQDLRQEVLEGKMPFDSIAYLQSEDPSARYNYGNLGYFTTFNLIYPFENQAYQTKIGEVSPTFRTRFGYHILKVIDKRQARGDIKVAIIRIKTGIDESSARLSKQKMDSIYQRLLKGDSFEELARRYSEDETAKNGGVLNPISSLGGPWPQEFKDAAFALQEAGSFSKPVKTSTEWLIIKLIEKKSPPSFESSKEQLKQRVQRDMRAEINKQVVLERLKVDNQWKEKKNVLNKFIKKGYCDSSILRGMYTPAENKDYSPVLFTIKNQKFTYRDFSKYLSDYQNSKGGGSIEGVIRKMYKDYVSFANFNWEEEHLEEKYPEFKFLYKEYHDGILLFDLTDKKVWSKAVTDTVGLRDYYQKNILKYQWGPRIDATFFTARNNQVANQLRTLLQTDSSTAQIVSILNNQDPLNITVKEGKFEKGDIPELDELSVMKPGLFERVQLDGSVRVFLIRDLIPSGPKQIQEAKGIITSDYQSFLEKEWIQELRKKYPVSINEETRSRLFPQ